MVVRWALGLPGLLCLSGGWGPAAPGAGVSAYPEIPSRQVLGLKTLTRT